MKPLRGWLVLNSLVILIPSGFVYVNVTLGKGGPTAGLIAPEIVSESLIATVGCETEREMDVATVH